MADCAFVADEIPEPDISHLVTEDDEPVDSILSEKQQRLLTETLYTSWKDAQGNAPPFFALANVGLFFALHEPPLVPDVMLSLDVVCPDNVVEKKKRSYLMWEVGKPPDIVIKIVSNREGGEEEKLDRYARIGIPYAVIFDPWHFLGPRVLRTYEHHGRAYIDFVDPTWLPELGLGLTLWSGTYEGMQATWLRWCNCQGELLPTGAEATATAALDVKAARQETDAARREADALRERNERMAARLRELGLDP